MASDATASVFDYLKGYKIGIEKATSHSSITMDYHTDSTTDHGSSCLGDPQGTGFRCQETMAAGSSSGFALYLGQPFRGKDSFYFGADLGFGLSYLEGSFSDKKRSQGLKNAAFTLLSLSIKPYIQFGWTPQGLPDILVSVGPVVQLAGGKVSINDTPKSTAVIGVSGLQGYFELEIVLWRFGSGGAFGLFTSKENSGNRDSSRLYEGEIDGMSDIKGQFSSSTSGGTMGYGLRLLLDIP